jgi:cellulose biosynthesis protein BcsQ
VLDALRERFGEVVMHSTIRESVRVAEAPGHRLPVIAYAPSSTAAADYRAAAAEFDARSRADGQPQADGRARRA